MEARVIVQWVEFLPTHHYLMVKLCALWFAFAR